MVLPLRHQVGLNAAPQDHFMRLHRDYQNLKQQKIAELEGLLEEQV